MIKAVIFDCFGVLTTEPSGSKNTPLLEYISELKRQGYKTGIISNIGSDWMTTEFLTAEEQQLFDAMTLSFEVGFVKPDKRIFEAGAKSLEVQLNDCVMIDDIEAFCEAAQIAGMKAILFQDLEQLRSELAKLGVVVKS